MITTQDRTGNRYAKVIDRGRPKHSKIFQELSPRITDEVTGLCSDGEPAYERFCEADGKYTRGAAWQELLTRTALAEP